MALPNGGHGVALGDSWWHEIGRLSENDEEGVACLR